MLLRTAQLVLIVAGALSAPLPGNVSLKSTEQLNEVNDTTETNYISKFLSSFENLMNYFKRRLPEGDLENIRCEVVTDKKEQTFIFQDLKGKIYPNRVPSYSEKSGRQLGLKKYIEINFFDNEDNYGKLYWIPHQPVNYSEQFNKIKINIHNINQQSLQENSTVVSSKIVNNLSGEQRSADITSAEKIENSQANGFEILTLRNLDRNILDKTTSRSTESSNRNGSLAETYSHENKHTYTESPHPQMSNTIIHYTGLFTSDESLPLSEYVETKLTYPDGKNTITDQSASTKRMSNTYGTHTNEYSTVLISKNMSNDKEVSYTGNKNLGNSEIQETFLKITTKLDSNPLVFINKEKYEERTTQSASEFYYKEDDSLNTSYTPLEPEEYFTAHNTFKSNFSKSPDIHQIHIKNATNSTFNFFKSTTSKDFISFDEEENNTEPVTLSKSSTLNNVIDSSTYLIDVEKPTPNAFITSPNEDVKMSSFDIRSVSDLENVSMIKMTTPALELEMKQYNKSFNEAALKNFTELNSANDTIKNISSTPHYNTMLFSTEPQYSHSISRDDESVSQSKTTNYVSSSMTNYGASNVFSHVPDDYDNKPYTEESTYSENETTVDKEVSKIKEVSQTPDFDNSFSNLYHNIKNFKSTLTYDTIPSTNKSSYQEAIITTRMSFQREFNNHTSLEVDYITKEYNPHLEEIDSSTPQYNTVTKEASYFDKKAVGYKNTSEIKTNSYESTEEITITPISFIHNIKNANSTQLNNDVLFFEEYSTTENTVTDEIKIESGTPEEIVKTITEVSTEYIILNMTSSKIKSTISNNSKSTDSKPTEQVENISSTMHAEKPNVTHDVSDEYTLPLSNSSVNSPLITLENNELGIISTSPYSKTESIDSNNNLDITTVSNSYVMLTNTEDLGIESASSVTSENILYSSVSSLLKNSTFEAQNATNAQATISETEAIDTLMTEADIQPHYNFSTTLLEITDDFNLNPSFSTPNTHSPTDVSISSVSEISSNGNSLIKENSSKGQSGYNLINTYTQANIIYDSTTEVTNQNGLLPGAVRKGKDLDSEISSTKVFNDVSPTSISNIDSNSDLVPNINELKSSSTEKNVKLDIINDYLDGKTTQETSGQEFRETTFYSLMTEKQSNVNYAVRKGKDLDSEISSTKVFNDVSPTFISNIDSNSDLVPNINELKSSSTEKNVKLDNINDYLDENTTQETSGQEFRETTFYSLMTEKQSNVNYADKDVFSSTEKFQVQIIEDSNNSTDSFDKGSTKIYSLVTMNREGKALVTKNTFEQIPLTGNYSSHEMETNDEYHSSDVKSSTLATGAFYYHNFSDSTDTTVTTIVPNFMEDSGEFTHDIEVNTFKPEIQIENKLFSTGTSLSSFRSTVTKPFNIEQASVSSLKNESTTLKPPNFLEEKTTEGRVYNNFTKSSIRNEFIDHLKTLDQIENAAEANTETIPMSASASYSTLSNQVYSNTEINSDITENTKHNRNATESTPHMNNGSTIGYDNSNYNNFTFSLPTTKLVNTYVQLRVYTIKPLIAIQ